MATMNTKICSASEAGSNCTFTTPSGLIFNTTYIARKESTIFAIAVKDPSPTDGPDQRPSPLLCNPNDFLTIGVFRATPCLQEDINGIEVTDTCDSSYSIKGAEVLECTLSFTTYTYSNTKAEGTSIITQNVTETPLLNGTATFNLPPGDTMTIEKTWFCKFGLPNLPLFTVIQTDWEAIYNWFTLTGFTGSFSEGTTNANPDYVALQLYSVSNLTRVFENIALSMTNQIRVTNPGTQVGYGLIETPVQFMAVSWVYIIAPLLISKSCSVHFPI